MNRTIFKEVFFAIIENTVYIGHLLNNKRFNWHITSLFGRMQTFKQQFVFLNTIRNAKQYRMEELLNS